MKTYYLVKETGYRKYLKGRRPKGGRQKQMESKLDIMDELHGVIEALKASNNKRQKIIDGLIDCMTRRDKEIMSLRRELKGCWKDYHADF